MIDNPGKKAPEVVNVVIEIPKGSNVKYEYRPDKDIIEVDRILFTAMTYPFNYGFVPGTMGGDNDPLDIVVLSSASFSTGTLVQARPIGVLLTKDEEGVDSKVIAVPTEKVDPDFANVTDINQLHESVKKKIGHFYSYYKSIEPGKWVEVTGWKGSAEAKAEVKKAIAAKK
ncbi:MAG: inorganic diphosphatase [Candidatus Micrarchaeota archaeon]|nr:inorganic diphosphatase [Candidatus Micrarchaeota archaeon]